MRHRFGLEDGVREPGTEFRDCPECPAMVTVPVGSYTMGSPSAEAGGHADEAQRRMTIDDPFAVGVYEVTFGEWDACAAAGGWGRGRQPVIDVSWDDAQEYVAWLSSKTGEDYRLLTEAEWEYVARACTTTPFHTGATISTAQANYDGLSAPYGSWRHRPIPRPADRGRLALPQCLRAVRRPRQRGRAGRRLLRRGQTTACTRRVLRGGSWGSRPELVRSAYRSWCAPTLRNLHNGFRVARTLTP